MKKYMCLLLIILSGINLFSQDETMELFLIDSYVTPEKPYTFNLSFFTSENVKTKVIIDQKYEITVSEEYNTDHFAEIDFTGKQVTLACKSPTNFVVGEDGSFISNRIPQGAVASLCFIDKGTYNYELRRGPRTTASVKTDQPTVHGTIVVE